MSIFSGLFDNLSLAGGPTLRDFQHARKLYVVNNLRLSPKFKHFYHVVLHINPEIDTNLLSNIHKLEVNLLAKAVDLPSYRINTETVNQYNRKKIVQTGIDYQPISIEFHDDNAGLTTALWESYYRYYYMDGNYVTYNPDGSPPNNINAYNSLAGKNRAYGGPADQKFRYGLDKPGKLVPFFKSIQVFQFAPQNLDSTFTSFTLINPIIEQMQHENLAQQGSEFSQNRLTISYEAVEYHRGQTKEGNAPMGFADPSHYDTTPSPRQLGDSGAIASTPILGQNNSLTSFINGINTFNAAMNIINPSSTVNSSIRSAQIAAYSNQTDRVSSGLNTLSAVASLSETLFGNTRFSTTVRNVSNAANAVNAIRRLF